jgi:hypothetical protein
MMLYAQEPDFTSSEKSARKAMLMSAIFPGAGQFYVDRSHWTTYIFPIVELGLWYTLFHYTKKGDDKTAKYEKYALQHYNREHQYWTQAHLIGANNATLYEGPRSSDGTLIDWGNGGHFKLDRENTQHFFEDIGKYCKYVFGWDDWFDTYVRVISPGVVDVYWIFNGETAPDLIRWIGNSPISDPSRIDGVYSELRDEYIKMRQKAEDYYSTSRSMRFYILLNHAVSVVDANLMARKYNARQAQQHSNYSFQPHIRTAFIDNNVTPILGISVRY